MTIGKLSNPNVVLPFLAPTDSTGPDAASVEDLLQSVVNSGFDSAQAGGQPLTVVAPAGYLPAPSPTQDRADRRGLPTVQQRAAQPGGFAGTKGNDLISEQLPATSLLDEAIGDGQANCLERAFNLAGPNDSVVLLDDKRDDSGHAVVRHPDGSITDPNDPSVKYASIGAYMAKNPQYFNPTAPISKGDLQQVFRLPPSSDARKAMIAKLGLSDVASRRVADSGNEPVDLANAIANAPTYSPTEMALLSKIKDPEQRAIQELQMQMQKQALLCTVLTNLAQMRHDMLKAVAQNLRS